MFHPIQVKENKMKVPLSMYCSVSTNNSERKTYVFDDMMSAYNAGCRVERDWLLFEEKVETDDGDVLKVSAPRRPIDSTAPTRFARKETTLKDGEEHLAKIPVFHFTETKPSPKTHKRTVCKAKLWKLYDCDYHRHIVYVDALSSSRGEAKWYTVYYDPSAELTYTDFEPHRRAYFERNSTNPFGYPEFEAHIEGKQIFGNFTDKTTGYSIFDIDFHEPIWNIEPCLELVRVVWKHLPEVMRKLGGYGLHAQLKMKHADGIHGLFFLKRKIDQAEVEQTLREFSVSLERRYPELMEARRNCCFPDTEKKRNLIRFIDRIGPNNHNGFRLPFCKGRQMIADKPIPVPDGKHDIVRFVEWQKECRRQWWTTQNSMSPDDVVDLLRDRFKSIVDKEAFSPATQAAKKSGLPATQLNSICKPSAERTKTTSDRKKEEEEDWVYDSIRLVSTTNAPMPSPANNFQHFDKEPVRAEKLVWRGNTKRIIVGTFTGQLIVPKSLDKVSCVLARIALNFCDSIDEAVDKFSQLLELIPQDVAEELSSRLAAGKADEVVKTFRQKVQRVTNGTLKQADKVTSNQILGQCVKWWKKVGFNPFVPKTWNIGHPLRRKAIRDIWTADDKMDFCDVLLPLLGRSAKWVDPVHLVNVCLYWVRRKEREENGMALNYWKAMLEGELNIPCGDNTYKRHQKVKNALVELSVIEQVVGPMFGNGRGMATRYAPGPRARKRGEFLSLNDMELTLANEGTVEV